MNGLFGAGIYLAENSSKSDEYCTPNSTGLCYMFLIRAMLGRPYEALNAMNQQRLAPSGYNSVIGVTKATHPGAFLKKYREFIIYDRYQTRLEFIIEFRRVP
ncbi:hypothetical protein GUITHDRAFT_104545 [Guillardia theta CCMP2712]|uniref:Poly [ADP-ribose] polymerase n=1 Tax=Guillardia theta (strain CCMP2712) TaxID=905079 RepID=L1JN16_GUITC|nr:hypothetical protein GUITHDRAFT_104545 [Guillardia theta CCMP2712]EKX49585.1 hypothetical protein GUITHDRAFT_104545 [Guillardia theta CCMP2712]|eukprot:XP_005836565.1 hypothetical protein GUITHDRAFT_104545 [Guillardia theta CCMP2712]